LNLSSTPMHLQYDIRKYLNMNSTVTVDKTYFKTKLKNKYVY